MSDDEKPKDLPTKSKDAAAQALAQAAAYDGLFAPRPFDLGNGAMLLIPPPPENLIIPGDENLEAYEALQFEIKSYDRKPKTIIPPQEIKDRHGHLITTLPAQEQDGDLIWPHQKTDPETGEVKRMPSYTIRLVKAVLGEEAYGRLAKAGKSASDIETVWGKWRLEIAAWRTTDSKSGSGDVDLAAVPEADSQ